VRKDRQSDLSAGVAFYLRSDLALISQIAYTENRSNVDLNAFRRALATLVVRYIF
jgi:hypothetical protein